jgi:adenylosuccinate synthase
VTHTIVVDLGYGDAGKGTVVDWLCASRPVHAVVRFNGGAQAGHNVVTPDGRHHTFTQLGSGTFIPGVRTHLSRFMLVDPLALAAEVTNLARLGVPDALERLSVDRTALLTTPYHGAVNRARELARGAARHGSCGVGIGETMAYALEHPGDAPRAGDCARPNALRRKLTKLHGWAAAQLTELGGWDGAAASAAAPRTQVATAPAAVERLAPVDACVDAYLAFAGRVSLVDERYLHGLLRTGEVVFEGAQGVLLDEWRGFHPYTTWSTTTFANADELLAEAGQGEAFRLGVVRAYTTRHGPGPLVTEDHGIAAALPEPHNGTGSWQGAFRAGHLDLAAYAYALEVSGGADGIAVTHLDRADTVTALRACGAYDVDGQRLRRIIPGPFADLGYQERLTRLLRRARPVLAEPGLPWAELIAEALATPVTLTSHGPTRRDKRAGPQPRAEICCTAQPLPSGSLK